MLKITISFLLISFIIFNQYAQCNQDCPSGLENGWCWGNDPGKAKEKNALYNDELKTKKYLEATEPLGWLLANTPRLNKAIYINGVKIYKALLKQTKDPEKKNEYQDKILELHDKRICYFGEKSKILSKKGMLAYPYIGPRAKENKALYDSLFFLYKEIFELNKGKKMFSGNIIFYMKVSCLQYQFKKMTEPELLVIFDEISDELYEQTLKAKNGKKKTYWEDCTKKTEKIFLTTVNIDCEFVKKNWTEDIKNNDVKHSRRAIHFMSKNDCTNDPLYLQAITNVFNDRNSFMLANIITKKYLKNKDYKQALSWYEKSLPLIEPDSLNEKFDVYLGMAKLKNIDGQKTKARSLALEAIKVYPTGAATGYEFIGDLYYSSAKLCRGKDPIEDRLSYLIAYDMYSKANAKEKKNKAAQQFPSNTDIFTYGYEKDKSIRVGCWINESTILRGRSNK